MSDTSNADGDKLQDIRDRLRALTQPLVDSLDSRLRRQIDDRVDQRVDATFAARLSVLERALADLDRTLKELEARLDS